ncbi:molybdenum metabolism regulator [Catellatospora sp. TT07R-123]|uniref:WGR domain-containing protein n=1 Tax=Catellatospora sp. TT07R-123 TaxID=2733863 RepID=UPI001B041BA0|nr:WGR domain-containing protein [Catellatospora sp. TT07R-123]GHJ44600.1 molybdenum metabolism regulator [Catellatospora sp. TT07R-123]
MPRETTYLELSEADGGSHKFYEVIVDDTELTIRYGRIGDPGATSHSTFADHDKAKAAAAKKIGEKVRKGYAPAVLGQRQKRSVSRRVITSTRSTAKSAPVLWRYRSGTSAFGIFVDERVCMVGNEAGVITTLNHDAEVISQVKLPDGVKCIVADDAWLYAGCDDGNVYDLSGKMPRVAYQIAPDIDIYWLDIHDGVLGVSDARGGIAAIDHEDEFLWRKQSEGSSGWMVRCDATAVHHGHSGGVTSYNWQTGDVVWKHRTSAVLFGWQEEHTLYAGTSDRKVVELAKDGAHRRTYSCDAAVFSCATSPDGKFIFAGDNSSSVYCFDDAGNRLWKLGTGCGSAYSMQYHDERLYIVTTDGSLACIDASEPAIRAAEAGTVPAVVDIKAPQQAPAVAAPTAIETTTDSSGGVVLECVEEGGRLRVRVVSAGFQSSWQVQFPKGIREAGARYLVSEVREASRGGFYRAFGEIRKLV